MGPSGEVGGFSFHLHPENWLHVPVSQTIRILLLALDYCNYSILHGGTSVTELLTSFVSSTLRIWILMNPHFV